MDIIEKLKQANLRGRGGAGFPAWQKWRMVKDAPAVEGEPRLAGGGKKYVICNVSEGEPAVFKDSFILEHWPEMVIEGIWIAMGAVGAQKGYIYLRDDYCDEFGAELKGIIGNKPIEVFREPCGYLGGEETTLLEAIEGKPCEPRIKPPFPPQAGLWGCPTLINNLETFYFAAKINRGEYQNTRFYCISGDTANAGVFELPESWSIKHVLDESGNLPKEDYFVQAGGGASGTILLSDEIDQPLSGAGAIIVHHTAETDPRQLALQWADFFINENCGKCVPCREGVYRLKEIFSKDSVDPSAASPAGEPLRVNPENKGSDFRRIDSVKAKNIVNLLAAASFCPFGKGVAMAFGSLMEKMKF